MEVILKKLEQQNKDLIDEKLKKRRPLFMRNLANFLDCDVVNLFDLEDEEEIIKQYAEYLKLRQIEEDLLINEFYERQKPEFVDMVNDIIENRKK